MEKENVDRAAPLNGLGGVAPAAPDWFVRALETPFESFTVSVDGATIDCRAWGDRGKPGLVFLHGNAAHLGWWDFLTPFFADDYRVVAVSFGGMGASDRRERYSIDCYAQEAMAATEAGGACIAGPPVMVGHSMGGMPVLRIAARHSERISAGIIVDSGLPGPEMIEVPPRPSHRVYPDIATALGRFRLSPLQPCENIYIADHLARMGLKQVDGGWTWCFDRKLWGDLELGDNWADLSEAKAPLAIIRGECSPLTGGAMGKRIREMAPSGTPYIEVPEAYHHVMVDQPLALVSAIRTLLAAWV